MNRLLRLPASVQRTLAILILFAGLIIAWCLIIQPTWWLLRSQAGWRERARILLAVQKGKAESKKEFQLKLESERTAPVWHAFLPGPNEELASDQIQRELALIAQAAGARQVSFQPIPKWTKSGLVAYGTRVSSSMTADQLKRFCGGIRGAPHFLRVERLVVSSPQVQNPDQNVDMVVSFDVFGFTREVSTTGANTRHPDDSTG